MPDPTDQDPAKRARATPEVGRSGRRRWWRVGGDRVEMMPEGAGFTARVWRDGWGPEPLVLDGHFAGEAQAKAWCEAMARVLAGDLEDEDD
ncbi:hypothetical protein P12x_006115 (plasmid) [Tundrisphaera lichenicola]|uniref:hypothetical protein n=1 Tax=Tundrisphaera lichenicola TaxID=2029860 RepID=UPI003EB7E871